MINLRRLASGMFLCVAARRGAVVTNLQSTWKGALDGRNLGAVATDSTPTGARKHPANISSPRVTAVT